MYPNSTIDANHLPIIPAGCYSTRLILRYGLVLLKLHKTKRHQRDELNAKIDAYLNRGGKVSTIERGISGRENATKALPHVFDKTGTSETRTPVNDIIDTLDERRKPKSAPIRRSRLPTPRKKMTYDDFGQPLRWEHRD